MFNRYKNVVLGLTMYAAGMFLIKKANTMMNGKIDNFLGK